MLKLKSIADSIPNLGYILFSTASLLIFIIAFLFNFGSYKLDIADTASLIFLYSSLGLIIKNSQFDKSKFYRFFLLSLSLLLISAVFKLLHIRSKEMFIIAFIFAILSYSVYFLKKKSKSILDYIKWFYFSSFMLLKLITINHYFYFDEIWVMNFISTVLIVILIYIKHLKTPNWLSL